MVRRLVTGDGIDWGPVRGRYGGWGHLLRQPSVADQLVRPKDPAANDATGLRNDALDLCIISFLILHPLLEFGGVNRCLPLAPPGHRHRGRKNAIH